MYVSQMGKTGRALLMHSTREALTCLGYEGERLEEELKIVAVSKVRDLAGLIDIRPYI